MRVLTPDSWASSEVEDEADTLLCFVLLYLTLPYV